MINRVILVGRLVKDPELRYTSGNGVAVASFTLAVNRPFKNNGQQEADFINCQVWRKPAENLSTYQKKGSLIGVDGRIQTRSFDGQDGKRVFVTEVVADSVQFLESKKNDNKPSDSPVQNEGTPADISDDSLPF
jgi:single-strand DNA-binding protein